MDTLTDSPIDISDSQEQLLLHHRPFLLNPLPTTSPPSTPFFSLSDEPDPTPLQPPIHMLSLPNTPDPQSQPQAPNKPHSPIPSSSTKPRPSRKDRWRVYFRRPPNDKTPQPPLDDDEDPFKQFRYVKRKLRSHPPRLSETDDEAGVGPPCRKLPGSLRTEPPASGDDWRRSPVVSSSPEFPADVFDVAKMLAGKVERRAERVDMLEVAEHIGVRFSPPKWHRPGGYDAKKSSQSQ